MLQIAENIEIDPKRAIARVQRDMRDDWFPDPLHFEDILRESHLKEKLKKKPYTPTSSELFNIPKSNFSLRYSLETNVYDRIVYQGIADALIPHFDPCLSDHVFSHRFAGGEDKYMFKNAITAFQAYTETVREALEGTTKVLVATDCQNFYECLQLEDLINLLLMLADEKGLDTEKRLIKYLQPMLKTWSPYQTHGLPQNRDASSFLANMYMLPVDNAMLRQGYQYFRYMDDIRIVCADVYEARRALRDLIIALRRHRLNVNSKKTEIVTQYDDRMAELLPKNRLLQEIDTLYKSKRIREVRKAVTKLQELASSLVKSGMVDSREFRFTVHRLVNIGRSKSFEMADPEFTDCVIGQLLDKPWCSDIMIKYLEVANLSGAQESCIADLVLDKTKYAYEWQCYLIWQLLARRGIQTETLLKAAWSNMRVCDHAPVKASSLVYLAACGDSNDKYNLVKQNDPWVTPTVRRAFVIAVRETNKRELQKCRVSQETPDIQEEFETIRGYSPLSGRYIQPIPEVSIADLFNDLPLNYEF